MLRKYFKSVLVSAGWLAILSGCADAPSEAVSQATTNAGASPIAVSPVAPVAEPGTQAHPLENFLASWVIEVPTGNDKTVFVLSLVSNENGDFVAVEKRCYYYISPGVHQVLAPSVMAPMAALASGSGFYSLSGTETFSDSLTDTAGNVRHCEAAVRGGEYKLELAADGKMWLEEPQGNVSGLPRGPYTKN